MDPSQGSKCSPRRTSNLSLQVGSLWNNGTTILVQREMGTTHGAAQAAGRELRHCL